MGILVFAVMIALCVVFLAYGIKNVRNGMRYHVTDEVSDHVCIEAEIVGTVHYDTPHYFSSFDESGSYDGLEIRYTYDGKEYEKFCADENFDGTVPIAVSKDNPDEFVINVDGEYGVADVEDENGKDKEKNTMQIVAGIGFIIGGLLCGGYIIFGFVSLLTMKMK